MKRDFSAQNSIDLQQLALEINEKSKRKPQFAVAKFSSFCESRELTDRVHNRDSSAPAARRLAVCAGSS
jgi:hypothetical protein